MADITNIMGGFNADEYEEQPEHDNSPLPAGEYYAEVSKAEVKKTANKKGTGCNVTFDILGEVNDKSQKGRKMFNWFNLQHDNPDAQTIGQREFHALRLAIGKPTANDTDELLGANLVIKVGFDKKDKERNQIKKYIALEGFQAAPPESKPAPAPAASAPVKKANPWD